MKSQRLPRSWPGNLRATHLWLVEIMGDARLGRVGGDPRQAKLRCPVRASAFFFPRATQVRHAPASRARPFACRSRPHASPIRTVLLVTLVSTTPQTPPLTLFSALSALSFTPSPPYHHALYRPYRKQDGDGKKFRVDNHVPLLTTTTTASPTTAEASSTTTLLFSTTTIFADRSLSLPQIHRYHHQQTSCTPLLTAIRSLNSDH